MQKLKMHSPNWTNSNIDRVAEIFPWVVTEALDEQGNPMRVVDFDLLRQELSDHLVEGPAERYRLDWPGKRAALFAANAPIAKTLRPVRDESVDFDSTQNLFVEGDNLDALKLLQEAYLGRVKLIYIDPPYNTGNDFLYADNYAASTNEYLARSGQADEDGVRLTANPDTNGRFHSDWLSMMYPRVRLARNLLTDDGFFCMSIDDSEAANAKCLLDEVFGARNFVATIVWQKRYVSNVTARHLSDMHDFIHVYARNAQSAKVNPWPLTREQLLAYKNPDDDPRGPWRAQDLSASKPYNAGLFTIRRNGVEFDPPPNRYWRCNREQFDRWESEGRIWWGSEGTARPMLKSFLGEKEATTTPHTWWDYARAGHNKEATLEMKKLFDGSSPFDTPKPVKLIAKLIETFTDHDSIVLDFFAGSGTTAHAVFAANFADAGSRRFILVQMAEKIASSLPNGGSAFDNIASLARERIRRSAHAIIENDSLKAAKLDLGFRATRVDTSNLSDVTRPPSLLLQDELDLSATNVKVDRTGEDLLFQVLLDCGLEVTLPISVDEVGKRQLYDVANNALIACFETDLDLPFLRAIAERRPLRVVFRDSGFMSDADRINAQQIFDECSPTTDLKVI